MTDIERLIALEEIKRLKYRYVRALDTLDWDLMGSCLSENVTTWYGNGTYNRSSREDTLAWFRNVMPPTFVSSHTVSHPEIDFTSDTQAEGKWRFEDTVFFRGPTPYMLENGTVQGGERLTGAGYYFEKYVKTDDQWQISDVGYVRLFQRVEWPDGREPWLFVPDNRGRAAA